MEKYLIHSNELHLIDQERIHQAVEQVETYFKDLDKRREINHLLGITDNTYDPTEDFGVC